MTWDHLRANRRRTDHDETQVCRVDQLLMNQGEDIRKLKAEVAGLEIDLESARSKLARARALNAVLLILGSGGIIVACHPW